MSGLTDLDDYNITDKEADISHFWFWFHYLGGDLRLSILTLVLVVVAELWYVFYVA